jgi:uncharacterized protein YjiS (DUF1127 family)
MNLRQKYRQWTTYFQTVSELSRCTDRNLEDLGIKRENIRTLARQKSALIG